MAEVPKYASPHRSIRQRRNGHPGLLVVTHHTPATNLSARSPCPCKAPARNRRFFMNRRFLFGGTGINGQRRETWRWNLAGDPNNSPQSRHLNGKPVDQQNDSGRLWPLATLPRLGCVVGLEFRNERLQRFFAAALCICKSQPQERPRLRHRLEHHPAMDQLLGR